MVRCIVATIRSSGSLGAVIGRLAKPPVAAALAATGHRIRRTVAAPTGLVEPDTGVADDGGTVLPDGSEAVLKLRLPDHDFLMEMEALRLFDGNGTVRLLHADFNLGAMVLERLKPGTLLSSVTDDERAIRRRSNRAAEI